MLFESYQFVFLTFQTSYLFDKTLAKLFKKVKQCQVRKFKHLQESPTHQNTPVPEHISKKWVINLASKDLSPGEVKLLQRGPKFAVSTPRLQGQVCIPSKHLQNGKGGHQNPQRRQHTCSTYCRQGDSHGSHG